MNLTPYIFCLLLTVGIFSLFLVYRKRTQEQQKIRHLCARVQAALEDTVANKISTPFASSLSTATMTTRLQEPRIRLQSGATGAPPEKYKFFSNMVARGMNAEEIAEVLNISTTEATQLVHLSGLSGYRN